MKEKIYNARTGMEYVLVGDYYLPALKLPRTRPVGRWGMLHKAYLKLRLFYSFAKLSKSPALITKDNEQRMENYLYREKCKPLLINCETVIWRRAT